MKSNFAALLVLFITGCGSDAVDATSTKIDETGGVAGTSTIEVGGDTSTTPGGSSAVTPGGSSSTTTASGGSSSTTTTTTPGGSSSTTTTTAAGSGQGGQGTQASGGSSQPGVGGSAPASGGSAVQTSGGSSSQATGGSATQATGGKAGAGSGGTGLNVGGVSTTTGGRTVVGTGGTPGTTCNPNNVLATCSAFQVCDATRHCAGPVRNTAIDCSGISIDGWKTFGYSSAAAPSTAFDTRARCQLAPTASTDPSVQNYCCNFNKDSCMVLWADFPPACPTTGATAGKPYLYDCLKGVIPPLGYAMAVANTEYTPVGTGYCYATQTVE